MKKLVFMLVIVMSSFAQAEVSMRLSDGEVFRNMFIGQTNRADNNFHYTRRVTVNGRLVQFNSYQEAMDALKTTVGTVTVTKASIATGVLYVAPGSSVQVENDEAVNGGSIYTCTARGLKGDGRINPDSLDCKEIAKGWNPHGFNQQAARVEP